MFVVVLAAFGPLGIISSLFAWQSYQAAMSQSQHRVADLLLGFVGGLTRDIRDTGTALVGLASFAGLGDPARCTQDLESARRLASPDMLGFTILDAHGTICRSGQGAAPDPALIARARATGRLVFGPVQRDPVSHRFVIAAAIASAEPAAIPGDTIVVSGAIKVDMSGDDPRAQRAGSIWLIDSGDHPWPIATAPGDLVPSASVIRHLLAGRSTIVRNDPDGRRWIFVAGSLPDGGRVVLGDKATDAETRAISLLLSRIVAIALLLLIGVVVVGIGAQVFVAAPVQTVTRRVLTWREGGGFDASPIRFVPVELTSLIDAFARVSASLTARETELQRAEAAQELAIKEIHHRVKNNLQIIASLLNLQGNRIRQPEARAEFQSARDRVKALATLHRHLYGEGGLHTIAMRPFLLELCGQLFQAMGEPQDDRIALSIEAPELEMSSDQAVPLSLIVTEAVSNSLKYAFPAGRSGRIDVRLVRLDARSISLEIVDDGVGIPAGRAETETGIRDGLGLTLIRGFARQLGAVLEVTEAHGTRYHLTMALQRQRDAADDPDGASGEVGDARVTPT